MILFNLEKSCLPDYSDLRIDKYLYLGAYLFRSFYYQCSLCSDTVQ